MSLKVCIKCRLEKDTSLFVLRRGKAGSYCKNCFNRYQRQHYQENKESYSAKARKWDAEFTEWYKSLKDGKECTDCRVSYPFYVLQFDHIGDDKTADIAALVGTRSKDRVLEEITKCELVCANCHAKRTYLRNLK